VKFVFQLLIKGLNLAVIFSYEVECIIFVVVSFLPFPVALFLQNYFQLSSVLMGFFQVVLLSLTRNIVNGFGVTGVEGAFRRSCETTMAVLREKEEVLHTVLQTFVHDPLLERMHSENRTQQGKQV